MTIGAERGEVWAQEEFAWKRAMQNVAAASKARTRVIGPVSRMPTPSL
jgi:hypothetical protein